MSNQHIQSLPHGLSRAAAKAQPAGPALRPGTLRAVVAQRFATVGRAIWHALEEHGRQRADRELLDLAERCRDSNPKLSRELRSYVRGGSTY